MLKVEFGLFGNFMVWETGHGVTWQIDGILLFHFGETPLLKHGDENILPVWGT